MQYSYETREIFSCVGCKKSINDGSVEVIFKLWNEEFCLEISKTELFESGLCWECFLVTHSRIPKELNVEGWIEYQRVNGKIPWTIHAHHKWMIARSLRRKSL